jgi:hypothetical protein
MEPSTNMNVRSGFERLLLVLGLLLLSVYFVVRIHGLLSSRAQLNRFWQARETLSKEEVRAFSLREGANPDCASREGEQLDQDDSGSGLVGLFPNLWTD